ncbi:Maf family protein [Flammeovirga kamogawensis]|uniref:dTTP/UTP pyrophosphatase n=1 Tax=Flammeovirga kamogawensis TaxID=373891 RepID=A0ABX8GXP4_9BACT|nr:Maf family protein [Flammeovirga kamogawensis]MBB6460827.1 septum formation protein [Flammeovirga kamogawensis]QWG08178.1 septum formation protein Maf [Flammeovirga kamogawensis]TRX69981.1 septum formation protein Maf [Flammeovirga kamogawensis]
MIDLKGQQLILASKSPRRAELLSGLDFDFTVEVREVDESYPSDLPACEVAEHIANCKADAFSDLSENKIVIFSDTVVVVENEVLGKPNDENEAIEMLNKLSGKTHKVYSAVCIQTQEERISFTDSTEVTFLSMNDTTINYYIKEKKPFDKAGSYGIQEWIGMAMIEKINGSYFTVMGLPTAKLFKELTELLQSK